MAKPDILICRAARVVFELVMQSAFYNKRLIGEYLYTALFIPVQVLSVITGLQLLAYYAQSDAFSTFSSTSFMK